MPDPNRPGTSYNPAGYTVCSHLGCTKKAWNLTDHACCGKPYHDTTHEYREQARAAAAAAATTPPNLGLGHGLLGRGVRRWLGIH